MKKIVFGQGVCTNLEDAMNREWILTNGLGGYASSTIVGANTRKYHGLLVSPLDPPWKRRLFLSTVDEKVSIGGEDFYISTNQYPGTIYPKGYQYMDEFSLDPLPSFKYSVSDFQIRKEIFMPYKTNTAVIHYEVMKKESSSPASLETHPLINSRELNSIRKLGDFSVDYEQDTKNRQTRIWMDSGKDVSLFMGSDRMTYSESDLPVEDRWYKDMEYFVEKDRGYDFREDHYNPGFFEIELSKDREEFNILVAAGANAESDFKKLYSENPESFEKKRQGSAKRLENLGNGSNCDEILEEEGTLGYLVRAADSFVVGDGYILGGYHWFTVWGRDSLISFPGVLLVPGQYDSARKVLLNIAKQSEKGIIPNRFGGDWKELNSADASLLFFYAVYKYLTYTDDLGILKELWGVLEKIIETFSEGIEDKIINDDDGLIWTGRGLTWMDARVQNECVTPREGKTVEINSLWYNALKIMEVFSEKLGKEDEWKDEADKVRGSFRKKFWNPEKGYLYDLVDGDYKDDSLRPNQLFSISLPFPILEEKRAKKILENIFENLVIPKGLRSLSNRHPNYRGEYTGTMEERDKTYHQGTAWSWLIGPYVTAMTRIEGAQNKENLRTYVRNFLESHMQEAGVGTISEVFSGSESYSPGGCISQAWGVGEVLRCYVEDLKNIRPLYENKYS